MMDYRGVEIAGHEFNEASVDCWGGRPQMKQTNGPALAPALLMPLVRGEHPWRERQPKVRGTGRSWPLEARVLHEGDAGRIPAALAWNMIQKDENPWYWSRSQTSRQVDGAEAIARLASDIQESSREPKHAVLAIPNSLTEDQQDDLLRALRWQGAENIRLLWRPVAAVLGWLRFFREQMHTELRPSDKVLSIHIGLEGFEADILKLSPYKNTGELLPARSRPRFQSVPDAGINLGKELFRDTENSWRDLWGKPDLFGRIASNPRLFLTVIGQTKTLWSWLEDLSLKLREHSIQGLVFTGMFSRILGAFRQIQRIRDILRLTKPCHVLYEGQPGFPRGVIARESAHYAAGLAAGAVVYLDTLPTLELLTQHQGQPKWVDLVNAQRLVPGGRVHRNTVDPGLYVSPGHTDLELKVYMEGHEFVREVVSSLPEDIDEREDISLFVSVEPARGNARVEVVAKRPEFLKGRSVMLDWGAAEDTGKTKSQVEDELPLFCPPTEKRKFSVRKWESALKKVADLEREVTAGKTDLKQTLGLLNKRLQGPLESAVSSSKEVGSKAWKLKPTEDLLIQIHDQYPHSQEIARRCLGYMSSDHPALQAWMKRQLELDGMSRLDWIVYGNCLRNEHDILSFMRLSLSKIRSGRGENWCLKAIRRILMFRPNALKRVPSKLCYEIFGYNDGILHVLEREFSKKNLKRIVMNSACCLVFLLRRRLFDSEFLAPDSPQAIKAKELISEMKDYARKNPHQTLNTSIGIERILQNFIDLINRRGGNVPCLAISEASKP